jgi:hypothetical protein
MSSLPLEADIGGWSSHVADGPKSDISTLSPD